MTFKYLDNIATADAAFEVEASDLNQLFCEAAEATFSIMADLTVIKPKSHKDVRLSADKIDQLMFDWLSELIYLKDKDKIIFSRFEVDIRKNKEYELIAHAWGEPIDLNRQDLKADVKAVTYYQFRVEEKDGKWFARVVVDI